MSREQVWSQKDLHATESEGNDRALGSIDRRGDELEVTAIGGRGGGPDLDDLHGGVGDEKNELRNRERTVSCAAANSADERIERRVSLSCIFMGGREKNLKEGYGKSANERGL